MAATDVDPPPINVPVVDTRNGMPTRALSDFLYRLWQRTGGNDNEIATVLSWMVGGGNQGGTTTIVEGGGGTAPGDPIFALLQTLATRQASEIEALRAEVDALRAELRYRTNGQALEASEDADSAQALIFAVAMPATRSYAGI